MRVTKLGHCCLVIDEKNVRVLTDPGAYSTGQENIRGIDIVLITHEHPDHFHIESLKTILRNNPKAKVITNTTVKELLEKERIPATLLVHGERLMEQELHIEALGTEHAMLHSSVPRSENTGYFVGSRLFYPGDALTDPQKPVEILALPVAGPWLTVGDAIDYALKVKPAVCFPVHDGGLKIPGAAHSLPASILASNGIRFLIPEHDKEMEF